MKTQKLILFATITCCIFFSCSKDETSPTITMLGKNPDTLIVKTVSSYDDPGATAVDDKDGDITSKIVVASNVNVNAPGHYLIYYTVEDNAHNISHRLTRVIEVVKADGNYIINATCDNVPNVLDTIQISSCPTYDTLTLAGSFYPYGLFKAVLSNGKYIFNTGPPQQIGMDYVEGEITVLGTNLTLNFTYHPDLGPEYSCSSPMEKY